ncbi:hypothetical protein A7E78_04655 [Syntrophotalea acetylenivorans]|uniref:DUF2933 domain-containing protein n=1 Tax=Syntrophotalea acetylenivorans TaxID=1842532 RepID=A0A1L3GML2_9BACT|nr:hypothetical protein [Syntrophotalea acetylenivorans]APG27186.1 hypothetical protein A7E78_04655 [Syntrophotalea acetylenivorans]
MKHHFWMIIGCVVPLILIFLLPLFGVGSGPVLFIFLIICFGMHLIMMTKGGHKHDGNEDNDQGGSHGDH